jgi:beta-lactam-binding protein with PASTA domain
VHVANGRAYSLNVGKGQVAYSSPGGGSAAYQGQTITLIISKGPPPIPEPDSTPPGVPKYCEKHPERPGCPPIPGPDG